MSNCSQTERPASSRTDEDNQKGNRTQVRLPFLISCSASAGIRWISVCVQSPAGIRWISAGVQSPAGISWISAGVQSPAGISWISAGVQSPAGISWISAGVQSPAGISWISAGVQSPADDLWISSGTLYRQKIINITSARCCFVSFRFRSWHYKYPADLPAVPYTSPSAP